jgi:hypothetical protein
MIVELLCLESIHEIEILTQFVFGLLQYAPEHVVNCLPKLLEEWFDLAEEADCAYAVAVAFNAMKPAIRVDLLADVMWNARGDRAKLFEEVQDFDQANFERESCAVQQRDLPICPLEQRQAVFVQFLNHLLVENLALSATLEVQQFLSLQETFGTDVLGWIGHFRRRTCGPPI